MGARRKSESEPLSSDDLVDVAAGLRRILGAVHRGELSASPGMVARLEGAIEALETVSNQGKDDRPI